MSKNIARDIIEEYEHEAKKYESYWREKIAGEIEAEEQRCEDIEDSRDSEEYAISRLCAFNAGHLGGLSTASAIAKATQ